MKVPCLFALTLSLLACQRGPSDTPAMPAGGTLTHRSDTCERQTPAKPLQYCEHHHVDVPPVCTCIDETTERKWSGALKKYIESHDGFVFFLNADGTPRETPGGL